MKFKVTMEQLREVIRLARNCQKTEQFRWLNHQDIMNAVIESIINPDPNINALCNYLNGLGYERVLDIEALMDYGGELLLYSEGERESLEVCYNYYQEEYGGDKGNIELAINYIVGKNDLADRLEAALNAVVTILT